MNITFREAPASVEPRTPMVAAHPRIGAVKLSQRWGVRSALEQSAARREGAL
jgi:hypothetical protein